MYFSLSLSLPFIILGVYICEQVTNAGVFGKFESFTSTKVTEWLWDYCVKWELVAFAGVDVDKAIVLQVFIPLFFGHEY